MHVMKVFCVSSHVLITPKGSLRWSAKMSHPFKGVDVIWAKGKQLASGDYTQQSFLRTSGSQGRGHWTLISCSQKPPLVTSVFPMPILPLLSSLASALSTQSQGNLRGSKTQPQWRSNIGKHSEFFLSRRWGIWGSERVGDLLRATQDWLVCPWAVFWHTSGPAHTLFPCPLKTHCTPPLLKERISIAETAHALCPDVWDHSS